MKKLEMLIVAAMLGVVLTGCGANAGNDEKNANEQVVVETVDSSVTDATVVEEGQDTPSEEGDGKHKVLDGGEMNDMCLELVNTFIDFSSQNVPDLGVHVERRSETNLIVSKNYGESNQLDVQYSRSLEKVGETKFMDKTFPNGYERVLDPNYGEVLYSVTKEEGGTRIVILQDVGDEVYLSIRMYEKSSVDPLLMIDEFMIKGIPVYWK